MKDDHVAVLLEDLHGKFDAVAEAVSGVALDIQSLKSDVHSIDARLDHVEQNISATMAAVTDQSLQLNRQDAVLDDHEGRLSTLESGA
jgi:DNA anti-recombination protein RmuC